MIELATSRRTGPSRDTAEVLAARARLLARPLETASGDHQATALIGFDAGESRFVVSTGSVLTVVSSVTPTPLPQQPGWLVGAVAVAGRIVTVVDLDRFLGAASREAAPDERATVLVLSDEGGEIALLVDRLAQLDATGAGIAPLPDGTAARVAQVVRGVVGGRHLLDPSGLVAAIRAALHPSTDRDTPRALVPGEHRK